MEDDIIAKLLPVLFVLAIATMPISAQYFAYRRRRDAMQTVREILGKDAKIDEAMVKTIVKDQKRPFADLRRGVLFLGFAISGFAVSLIFGEDIIGKITRAAAVFPGIAGLSYLAFHFFLRSDGGDD